MKSNVTMRDIAVKLGVSSVTVSKALNDKEGVSEELKLKIKDLAEEMGYRFNVMAKSMKEGCSYNIGVIIPERFTGEDQSFYLKFYQHITKMLERYNYYGILQILPTNDEEKLILPRTYYENKVDGFVILGQVSSEYIDLLTEHEIPKVLLDFYTDHSEVDSIVTDNFYGVYELTNYLIKNGHREIAFIGNIHSTSSIQDRYLGYYKSLLEHKIPLNTNYIINDRDERGKYIDLELPEQLPTAFVCNCDQVGFNLINKLISLNYSIPDDCSVVGFDNDIYSTLSNPPLTTVQVDTEEMAKVAVKFLIEKIKDKNKSYGRVLIKGKIIHRDSVKTVSKEGHVSDLSSQI
ncbi:transcriptional regulator [Alkalihalobacillus alcalophilus ATCC 27647 = CGMCC 1.3604]|uniref:Transcriptional regulator n=1 Tax=Alkalihalobacillus alcalophilus ATCC 27647 = CGMCC 1.3604 TaxID=1218173 RepID=A0A094YWB3_ALKAL|nr:substrate-binding domain-containing protein [Alkalihalobacillus alcalophilus]KGA97797.1 transcriptional regulator [Alkalihalobacillus alcalophilus ATCC 27647 = CGMCC 1.3604]MED1563782.1 substrate-binding domain-containing protein [Alkalihalobacillus alcalophilus]THG89707.1 transcriptional regulator [Alkalihalobacillus alcalophilus ATCC 27647 = CGMCC 1.3604]